MNDFSFLNLTRPLVVYDVETTGLDTSSDRIIEVGFQVWYHDKPVKEWRSLIDPGVPIPPAATKVHGIGDESFRRCARCGHNLETHPVGKADEANVKDCVDPKRWPTFKQLAANLATGFTDCDFAGKNVRFDLRITAAEMVRAGVQWSYAAARIIDADRLEQLGEPRHLSDLYKKHTGKTLDDAHQALADVRATTEVIAAQLQKYDKLPRDLDLLHKLQWPGQIDEGGKFKMVNGVATCQFGKWRGKPMKDIDPSYWDWILKSDFPADVKQLASEARMGRFPE